MIKDGFNQPAFNAMPQVTFVLFAYNQEQFIREAVSSALMQDYESLNIIISDDFSSDTTFEIIKSMVDRYIGPHKIILNRNETNLGGYGFCAHVNKVFELVQDDLIIIAAGDDISLPERTSVIVDAWLAAGKPSGSLHSAVRTISTLPLKNDKVIRGRATFDDLSIRRAIRTGVVGLLGCSHAITRDIFTGFGRLPDSIVFEDRALAFRSFLAGKIIYCDRVLVRYRIHTENLSGESVFNNNEKWQRWINNIIGVHQSFLLDFCFFNKNKTMQESILNEIKNSVKNAENSRLLVNGNFTQRLGSSLSYTKNLAFADRLAFTFKIFGWNKGFVFKVLSSTLKFSRKIGRLL